MSLGPAQQASRSSSVTSYRLRFRVPRIAPGLYVFVIWRGGAPGAPGTLVLETTQPRKFLRVGSARNPVASQGSGTDALWVIAAAAAVIAVAGGAVILRRRKAE
jgi:hypothetical protein